MTGPLDGVLVIEVGGIGPGPFAGMMLADLGAEVIRVDRPTGNSLLAPLHAVLLRGRKSVVLDLKVEEGRAALAELVSHADVLIEGFRPGVMERLGLGPDELLAANPRLVYGRMTGWGQSGPLAQTAGHDINYIAAVGALAPIVGNDGAPTPPLNMLGDFGGGGMLLVAGVLAALLHAQATGVGQVVDAAIVDGTALLTAMHHSMIQAGAWGGERGENLFDGGAPYYGTYATSDGGWLALGAIEPQFYAHLVDGLDLRSHLALARQDDTSTWQATRRLFRERIGQETSAHWATVFAGTDACVNVVATTEAAWTDEHLKARGTFVSTSAGPQPAPAPRFSVTRTSVPEPLRPTGADTLEVLARFGIDSANAVSSTMGGR